MTYPTAGQTTRMQLLQYRRRIREGQRKSDEMYSKVVVNLHRGKAIDIDGLTSEHILFSHPVLPLILTHFSSLILRSRHVPIGFKRSYIVPIPKPKDTRSKAMSCNDFRAIAILSLYYQKFLNIVFLRSSDQYLQLKTINSVLRKV